MERGRKDGVLFRVNNNPHISDGRPGKGVPMMTIVRTQEGTKGSDPEMATVLDELA